MSIKRIDGGTAQTAIISLSILKSISTMHGNGIADEFIPLETGWDTVHHLFFKALDLCADKVRERFFEYAETEVTAIEDENMTEYFKLAYKLGGLKKLTDDKNSYLIDAVQNNNNTLGDIGNYSFDYHLYFNKRRKPRLMLMFYPEFYPNAEVIYQLYNFFGFYRTALPLLQSELKELEATNKSKKMRLKKTAKRRRAA